MKYRQNQASVLLCGSLIILESKGIKRPMRKQILSFLRSGHVNSEMTGDDIWKDGDGIWKQLFSWCREDKAREGLLAFIPFQDYGIWRLSEQGRKRTMDLGQRILAEGFSPDSYVEYIKDTCGECLMTPKFVGKFLDACRSGMRAKELINDAVAEAEPLDDAVAEQMTRLAKDGASAQL